MKTVEHTLIITRAHESMWHVHARTIGSKRDYADSLVTNHDITIESIADPFVADADVSMLASRDWGQLEPPPFCPPQFNCGNFILLRKPRTDILLMELRDMQDRSPQYTAATSEQKFLYDIACAAGRGGVGTRRWITVLPRRVLNSVPADIQPTAREYWHPGDFLAHLTGVSNQRRLEWLAAFDNQSEISQ